MNRSRPHQVNEEDRICTLGALALMLSRTLHSTPLSYSFFSCSQILLLFNGWVGGSSENLEWLAKAWPFP